jgi:hypothetical protein
MPRFAVSVKPVHHETVKAVLFVTQLSPPDDEEAATAVLVNKPAPILCITCVVMKPVRVSI